MVGAGSMGGMMALLFAELGVDVHIYDPSSENTKTLLQNAENVGLADKVHSEKDYESLYNSLGSPKVFVFSLPHGSVGDKTIASLEPFLQKGDIIMDASNENWKSTERRQARLDPKGIHFIGMGVSGGYQSARHGPSISPGGSPEAISRVLPFLEKAAAKDSYGKPCVANMGPGGSGHYVKMIHNGIEQGMMSALCEAWSIMNYCLGLSYAEIGDVFEAWNTEDDSSVKSTFLVAIGIDICRTKDLKNGDYVLSRIKDKVVQDVDETEGTGTWAVQESARLHVPTPTIAAAHLFRLASVALDLRQRIQKNLNSHSPDNRVGAAVGRIHFATTDEKKSFLKDLRGATYLSFLLAFTQGLDLLAHASTENKWSINFSNVIHIWRSGCIIQCDTIADLLSKIYTSNPTSTSHLLTASEISIPVISNIPSLTRIVQAGLTIHAPIPVLSASLEYIKYMSGAAAPEWGEEGVARGKALPTEFMEAELDYFGRHMFDVWREGPGKPVTGERHWEWKPAGRRKEGEGR
ncbi:MAG: hypothetical protein MMC33_008095 [Icmadophila ericetorum]|nr:hypothetical protein [Icmadophila ericetorum]